MVSFSSRISPRTSTVIFFDKSPLATAMVTSAMLRTWPVRFAAIEFTLSVRSFQVPATPWHLRLAAELAFGTDFARHAAHFAGESVELVDHRVDGVLERENFALHVDGDLAGQVAARDGRGHVGDVADLAGEVGGHRVHVVGEVLPGAGHARHLRLTAELAFGADFARHARHFRGEAVELVHHRVDGFLSSRISPFTSTVILRLKSPLATAVVTSRDVAHLAVRLFAIELTLSVRSFHVPATPCTLRLTAELAFGAHFARHAAHFGGEAVELVHHRVDACSSAREFRPSRRR